MEKKKTFLLYYEEWMKARKLPMLGLCGSLILTKEEEEIWQLLCPTVKDLNQLIKENKSTLYWGVETPFYARKPTVDYLRKFTTLRQTLLLLAACLNDEL